MNKKIFSFLTIIVVALCVGQDVFSQKKKKTTTKKKQPVYNVSVLSNSPEKKEKLPPNLSAEQKRRYEAFDLVWKTINENYFDQTFNGLDWSKIRTEFLAKTLKAQNDGELHIFLQEMITRLNRSHFYIIPPEIYQDIEAVKEESHRKEQERKEKEEDAEEKSDELENSLEDEEDNSTEIFFQYGVPIDLRIINSQAVITEVKRNSQAEKSGLKQGFVIDKINGVSVNILVSNLENHPTFSSLFKKQIPKILISFLEGEEDSEIELTYLDEKNQSHTVQFKREGISGELVQIVQGFPEELFTFESKSLDDRVGYIRFNIFAFPVLNKFCAALTEFKGKDSLIIDLRGNLGGALSVLYGLAGLLTNKSISVGTEISKVGKQVHRVDPMPKNFKGKIVILVDDQSVSAAEILASGLKENNIAKIIGEQTAGEALPAMTLPLATGAVFIFPVSNFESPKGNIVEGKGVDPDFKVSLKREFLLEGRDIQLEKALDYFRETIEKDQQNITQQKNIEEDYAEPPPPVAKPKIVAVVPSNPVKPIEKSQDPKALEIVDKFVKAMGGEESLHKVSSYVAHGEVEIERYGTTISGRYNIYRKAPNKVAEVMNFEGTGDIREIFDGKDYLVQSLFQGVSNNNHLISEYESFADFYEFLKFKEIYPNIKYIGMYDSAGRKVQLLEAINEKGVRTAFSFDAETNLLMGRIATTLSIAFDDYKKFGNLLMPTTYTKSNILKIKLTSIELNIDIPEATFIKEDNCFTTVD